MLYYLTGCVFCIFCARRMQYTQRRKNTWGWNILLLAAILMLATFVKEISSHTLLITIAACPIAAALPTLFFSHKHPNLWFLATMAFNIALVIFFYYLLCVWVAFIETPYGQALPWWADIWK